MGCGSSKVSSAVHVLPQHNNNNSSNNAKKDTNGNVTSSKSLTSCDEDDDDSVGTIQLGSSNKLSIIDSIDNFAKRKRKLFSSVDIFENVDKRSTHVPSSSRNNPEELVSYLIEPYATPLLRLRAIWIWVTHNISYDTQSFFNPEKKKKVSSLDASDVLSTSKAICSGYTNLFNILASLADVQTERINGYSKGFNYVDGQSFTDTNPNHAWNAVYLNNNWWLLDATWGAGYVDENREFVGQYSEHYFLTDPRQFIYDHYPVDVNWQLLEEMIPIEQFEKYARVTKHFFRLHMKLFSHREGVIQCDTGKLHLKLRLDKDIPVKCTGKLMEEGADNLENGNGNSGDHHAYTHIYSTEKTLHVLVDVPKEGDFKLKLFAREIKSDIQQLSLVCSYSIKCTGKLGKASIFPRQFRRWGPGFYLHSPTEGILYNGETYKFRITLPNISDMAVCLGGRNSTWEKITNTKSALWEGEITLSDWVERVNVVARFKEKSPYSSVLEYKVIEKDWK